MLETVQAILAIVLIDLALSGDNALVIGMAARGLPKRQRRRAIVFGGLGAVVLRIAAASVVTLLLAIPYLQLIASIALLVIAYRLVRPGSGHGKTVREATTLREAITTILIADAAMSLENVLGVGAAAHGSIPLLVFGLALSIPHRDVRQRDRGGAPRSLPAGDLARSVRAGMDGRGDGRRGAGARAPRQAAVLRRSRAHRGVLRRDRRRAWCAARANARSSRASPRRSRRLATQGAWAG